ncbi:MAG: peptidoglycan DD-metalloendopeptidase family protein [Patescibacteria group bacterium]|jgi:murein DD-endopeptidase MepM/ murein hydrolase activator NlpD|nr:peptidoglycan DD-metalloendopeptidase family protein [Patescibacteria group bacterium]
MFKDKKRIILITIIILLLLAAVFYYYQQAFASRAIVEAPASEDNQISEQMELSPYVIEKIEILAGDTFGQVAERAALSAKEAAAIYEAAKEVYDLARIKAGAYLELIYDRQTNELLEVVYKIDSEEELVIIVQADKSFIAQLRPIAYDVKVVHKEAKISDSLYLSALEVGMDEKAIIALAEAFQWSIDFAMDPRVGDTFKVIYEERYLQGEYVRPGKILAARYVNDGTAYELYYFHETDDNEGYFDKEGNSVQKMFLKAPVAFKYISSGFTTGLRYVEAFNVSTGHRAIDYAAPSGTPIRSVGDGTVTFAGWNGPYGYMVSVRHNGTYSTNYAHMSKMTVKKGAKVKQGDVIGYVGSTGFSTGPHLHYEMVRNGIKINPLNEVLPPGQAISAEHKERFLQSIADWQGELRQMQ